MSVIEDYAWYEGNSGGKAQPVGEKKPNAWGLYDMGGNVMEWIADGYGNYSAESQTNPGPLHGLTSRVIRGGSFADPAEFLRSAFRSWLQPGSSTKAFAV